MVPWLAADSPFILLSGILCYVAATRAGKSGQFGQLEKSSWFVARHITVFYQARRSLYGCRMEDFAKEDRTKQRALERLIHRGDIWLLSRGNCMFSVRPDIEVQVVSEDVTQLFPMTCHSTAAAGGQPQRGHTTNDKQKD